jgi:16S rRNA (guanine966-N2)-methyltransferase
MSIKILGGFARGQSLSVPKGDVVRPTSVLLRRRIYDFYQDLEGCAFVDICAGSGAMGFEAWSRGAEVVYFNEVNKKVLKSLEENRENFLLRNNHKKNGRIVCSHTPAEKFIDHFKEIYKSFSQDQKTETIIFLDPPYSNKEIYLEVIKKLTEEPWFFGQLWIESDSQKGLPKETWSDYKFEPAKLFEQGGSYIFVTNFPQN